MNWSNDGEKKNYCLNSIFIWTLLIRSIKLIEFSIEKGLGGQFGQSGSQSNAQSSSQSASNLYNQGIYFQ